MEDKIYSSLQDFLRIAEDYDQQLLLNYIQNSIERIEGRIDQMQRMYERNARNLFVSQNEIAPLFRDLTDEQIHFLAEKSMDLIDPSASRDYLISKMIEDNDSIDEDWIQEMLEDF